MCIIKDTSCTFSLIHILIIDIKTTIPVKVVAVLHTIWWETYWEIIVHKNLSHGCNICVDLSQACRGGVKDEGQEAAMTDDDQHETDAGRRSTKIPIEADILLSQATSPGNNRWKKSNGAEIVPGPATHIQKGGRMIVLQIKKIRPFTDIY